MVEIENPWCIYGLFLDSLGKISRDNGSSVEVLYNEGQMYPPQLWRSNFVKRFSSPKEAIEDIARRCDEDITEKFKEDFPSTKALLE